MLSRFALMKKILNSRSLLKLSKCIFARGLIIQPYVALQTNKSGTILQPDTYANIRRA